MTKTAYMIPIGSFSLTTVGAQTGFEEVLPEVERNNKFIKSEKQHWGAKAFIQNGIEPG